MRNTLAIVAACAAVGACARTAPSPVAAGARYDLLITNGTIVDGTGAPRFLGDVAISGDHIARLEHGYEAWLSR